MDPYVATIVKQSVAIAGTFLTVGLLVAALAGYGSTPGASTR